MLDRFSIRGATSEPLREHIVERLTHALDQHERHVTTISVHIEDMNGPKGGDDQRCNVIVSFKEGGEVVVDERGADAYAVASTAADRVKQAVSRRMDKLTHKDHHGIRPPH